MSGKCLTVLHAALSETPVKRFSPRLKVRASPGRRDGHGAAPNSSLLCFLSSLSFFRLPGQCQYWGLPVADYFKQWINLKKAYSVAMGCWPKNGLLDMNKGLGLQYTGRPHSGIEDCRNVANIMKTLACRGFILKQTSKPF